MNVTGEYVSKFGKWNDGEIPIPSQQNNQTMAWETMWQQKKNPGMVYAF